LLGLTDERTIRFSFAVNPFPVFVVTPADPLRHDFCDGYGNIRDQCRFRNASKEIGLITIHCPHLSFCLI
jgi:hypothetical protein